MFSNNVRGLVGVLIGTVFLGSACGYGDIGGSAAPPRIGEAGPDIPVAPECPGASADVSASSGWQSSEASLPASGALYFEFMARPTVGDLNGLIAIGAEDIDDFAKAAIAVRFAENGLVDVRDGASYRSDLSYAYDPGDWYTIAISADTQTKTYDVEIGSCDGPRETLIESAAFRSDADVADELTTWAVWSAKATPLDLSTPTWLAAGGCATATCESLGHECGQPSDGCGGVLSCGGCASGQTCTSGICVDDSSPPPPPPGGGGFDPNGRGPTGQWPPGFPAYSTPADIVTNGTGGSLSSALNNAACSNGCVIEHPGNVTGDLTRIGSGGEIVVRPPIGQRANFGASESVILDNDLVIAGYRQTGRLWMDAGINSGYAWIEASGGGSSILYRSISGTNNGLLYEYVNENFGGTSFADRMLIIGLGNPTTVEIVGAYIKGGQCAANTPQNCHSDAIQFQQNGGTAFATIRDSIIWPSWDKGIQGISSHKLMEVLNTTLISPSEAKIMVPSLSMSSHNIGSNAGGWFENGTLIGSIHPTAGGLTVSNSVLWNFKTSVAAYNNGGGNTIAGSRPAVPAAPTHDQLDAIWSP